MSLPAGELRHRIDIDQVVKTQDPNTGATSTSWKPMGRFWARVTPLSGKEIMSASAEHSAATTRIKMRYRDDISATMRVRHRNRMYNIHAVLPDNESGLEWMTLLCSEGLNDGR